MMHATLMDSDSFIQKLLKSKNWKVEFQGDRSHELTEYVLPDFDSKFLKRLRFYSNIYVS